MSSLRRVIEADRRLIDAELRKALRFGRDVPARLATAMRYAVMGPGKRVRPMLALEAFRAAGGRNLAAVLPFCTGIELIHTFSLIHDDLPSMDNDDFRRGRPSLHRKFDEGTAILAADGLFAYAFELFAQAPGPAERRLAAIRVICRAVGPSGMTGGQMMDISHESRGESREARGELRVAGYELREARGLEILRMKTAEFIAAAVVGGAILGGATLAVQQRLRQAGLALGMLFQMTDDLLDSEAGGELRVAGSERKDTRGEKREARGELREAGGVLRVAGYELREAEVEARKAERLFNALGAKYRLLAAYPELILRRKS